MERRLLWVTLTDVNVWETENDKLEKPLITAAIHFI